MIVDENFSWLSVLTLGSSWLGRQLSCVFDKLVFRRPRRFVVVAILKTCAFHLFFSVLLMLVMEFGTVSDSRRWCWWWYRYLQFSLVQVICCLWCPCGRDSFVNFAGLSQLIIYFSSPDQFIANVVRAFYEERVQFDALLVYEGLVCARNGV